MAPIRPAGDEILTREAAPARKACEGSTESLFLTCSSRLGSTTQVALSKPRFRLGSAPDNDLVLQDPFVSRNHAILHRKGGDLWLLDEGSRNGTWVNEVRVERCQVGSGARIVVGRSNLMLNSADLQGRGGADSGMVARHPSMVRVLRQIERLGPRSLPVLILGETGTGKELVARGLHQASIRRHKAFEPLNCSAIPRDLAESELFGHEKGAFTGAAARRPGAFERATAGTLFLDEVGDMPLGLQPKLLRVLEDGLVQRVGGGKRISVDVRVVAATHRDLPQDASQGKFRLDLYHRLAVGMIKLPPLRERVMDIPLLVDHILTKLQGGGPPLELDAAALELLLRHPWPGNVRELYAALCRASTEAGPHLGAEDFSFLSESSFQIVEQRDGWVQYAGRPFNEVRREVFLAMVARHQGNRSAAATALGIPKSTFFDQLSVILRAG